MQVDAASEVVGRVCPQRAADAAARGRGALGTDAPYPPTDIPRNTAENQFTHFQLHPGSPPFP